MDYSKEQIDDKAEIEATGIYFGNQISVKAFEEDGSVMLLVDGLESESIQADFRSKMINAPPIGGTFYPEPDTMLAAYTVLEQSFFEKVISLTVTGKLGVIPFDEGKVY